ncbi:MAG: hydrogenase nickel incorporation protein HypB [bacterium]
MKIPVVKNILSANQQIADENRRLFREKGIYVMNLMSSPGEGKTTLLEHTLRALKDDYRIGVIEGDIEDTCDSERIMAMGVAAVQINTGGACHLDAPMIRNSFSNLPMDQLDILIIENVGNLVCPAEFDCGEHDKMTILSVTAGDDKPFKYPLMFSLSKVLFINKIDLLPYVDFDIEKAKKKCLQLSPDLTIFEVSCKDQSGLSAWFDWLKRRIALCCEKK